MKKEKADGREWRGHGLVALIKWKHGRSEITQEMSQKVKGLAGSALVF